NTDKRIHAPAQRADDLDGHDEMRFATPHLQTGRSHPLRADRTARRSSLPRERSSPLAQSGPLNPNLSMIDAPRTFQSSTVPTIVDALTSGVFPRVRPSWPLS